jgi:hypothetical protein
MPSAAHQAAKDAAESAPGSSAKAAEKRAQAPSAAAHEHAEEMLEKAAERHAPKQHADDATEWSAHAATPTKAAASASAAEGERPSASPSCPSASASAAAPSPSAAAAAAASISAVTLHRAQIRTYRCSRCFKLLGSHFDSAKFEMSEIAKALTAVDVPFALGRPHFSSMRMHPLGKVPRHIPAWMF